MRAGAQRALALWAALAFVAASASATPARAESDPLYYVVEDGKLVFTNTPDTKAKPVPGWENRPADRPSQQNGSSLPTTIYDPFIERVAREHGLSPGLIKAVALVESGFDPHAVSPKGARGLMQLMPGTAEQYGVTDAFDPLQNLRAGTTHLAHLLDQFDGDLTLALAAYNAGAGAVRRHGGVPEYRETQAYLRKVKANMGDAAGIRTPRGAGQPSPEYADVKLVRQADGSVLLAN